MLRISQYLPLRSGSRGNDTKCEHFTLPLAGTIICANFSFTFIDLTLANVLDDRSTILRGKVPNLFHAYCQRLKYILLCCSLRYFLLLHRKVSHQARYRIKHVTSYHLLVRWIFEQSVKSLGIQASPRASTFVKNIFATTCGNAHHWICAALTQPSLLDCNVRMYAVAFVVGSIHAASFKPQHPHTVAPALRYTHASALMPQRRSTRKTLCERSWRTHENESRWGFVLRFETVAVTYATLCACRKLNKMPGHNVLCGAARRGATGKVASMH